MTPIDVTDLKAAPGSSRSVGLIDPIPGLAVSLAKIPEDRPIQCSLLLEGVSDGVLVSGTLSSRVDLTCARCLRAFDGSVEVRVRELFSAVPDEDGYPLVEPGEIDLEPMIRDAVVLALPFAPVCRAGCLGLCPRCGKDRNIGACTCPEHDADPRWAALDALAESFERVDQD